VLEVDERTPPLLVHEGESFKLQKFPLGTQVLYPPDPLAGIRDVNAAIRHALLNPLGSEPLPELLKPGMRLTIAFDDISLPLPPMVTPDIRGRVIEHERPWYLRVAVRQQAEQGTLALPGAEHGGGRRDEHPAQQQEQHDARAQARDPDHRQQAPGTEGLPAASLHQPRCLGYRARGHAGVPVRGAQAGQRADGRQAPAQPERLPEHDRGGRGTARPAGDGQRAGGRKAYRCDSGEDDGGC